MKTKILIVLTLFFAIGQTSFADTNTNPGGGANGGEVRAGGGGGIKDMMPGVSDSNDVKPFSEHSCAGTGEKVKCENSNGCSSDELCAPIQNNAGYLNNISV